MRYDLKTDPSIDLIDAVHDNQRLVSDVCHNLEDVARALSRVGMRDLADEIGVWITPLMQSAKQVAASYSLDVNKQIAHGEAMIGGLLLATINGNIVPTPEPDRRTPASQSNGTTK